METLQGKKAIVTGGSKGVGKAIALALAKEGVKVALIARNENALNVVVEEIKQAGGEASYVVADVSSYEAATNAVRIIEERLGTIDILINNAAIAAFGSTIEMEPAMWEEIIRVNLFGVYYITKALLPQMIKNKAGDIVTIASSAGLRANENAGAYSASKFAIIGFMEALMNEVRKFNIRVSTLAPSTIATDMAESLGIIKNKDSIMQPEDLAEFIVHQLKLNPRVFIKSASIWATNP